ncbi:uncharacterized protein LOC123552544 [Mercenaria mercenaria]|uniref:uncharacterized protein LOC123552544 n=1 Tax=Mercenaria mercenaria TaxID=6596 RepID=UPI00234FB3AB|nr:uncharacterized protein LOC123552544 [Mercenaria mercenaria]
MKTLKHLVVFFIATFTLVSQVKCQPQSLQAYQSTSACFGSYSEETNMNATCNDGHVIAIGDLTAGAKPDSAGCPTFYNASYDFSLCCTYNQNTDCVFPFFAGNKLYHENCNGVSTCYRQAQRQDIDSNCASTNGTFSGYSHFMFMEFFCIEENKMVDMCSGPTSLTRENTELYIWNRDFPSSSIRPTDINCNCSVEIDNCQAGISIYNIYRQLTANGTGKCNRTLRVGDFENNAILFAWTCDDDTVDFESNTVQNTYILINFENQRNETAGKFWLGFGATAESNITVSCPPTTQQYCQQTTTSTTTVTMTTMTTMNMKTTTETESSTSTTTSTEPPTTPTTAAKNETTAAGVTSSAPKDNNLLAAVIGLGVLEVLLLIVIVVLSCCLYRRCYAKTKDDVEKVAVDNKQSPPPPDVTQTRPDLKQSAYSPTPEIAVPVNAVDVGCQVQIDQVYTKEGLVEQVIIQKTDNATTKKLETTIKHAEIGCQVNLFPPEIQTDNSKTEEGTNRLPQIQLIDKETLTLSISQSDRQCQTDVLQKKSQKVQANIVISTPVKIASCQTDTVMKDDAKQEDESKPLTTVPNGTIPTSPRDERSAIPMKSECVIPPNHRNKRKTRKKKKNH